MDCGSPGPTLITLVTSHWLGTASGRLSAMLSYTTIGEVLRGGAALFLRSIRQQSLLIHDLIYRHYVHYSIQSALSA